MQTTEVGQAAWMDGLPSDESPGQAESWGQGMESRESLH